MLAAAVLLSATVAKAQNPTASDREPDRYAITTPNGVDEEQFLEIGGIRQWVTIRGDDRANPVLLIVGGNSVDGPGATMSYLLRTFQPWERDFTVVQWDPRDAGKTFVENGKAIGPDVTIDRMVQDGIEVAEDLRRRLGKRKIVLMGINFGSTLGVKMAMARPDVFSAYVGAGQIVRSRAEAERFGYARVLRLATAAHDEAALADLAISGPEPFRQPRDPAKVAAFVSAGAKYRPPNPDPAEKIKEAASAPNWTVPELMAAQAAMPAAEEKLGRDWGEHFDFDTLGPTLRVPVFVIQGEDNDTAPTPFAEAWLDKLKAPKKGFVAIPVAGNHAIETHGAAFLDALDKQVRPIAVAADRR